MISKSQERKYSIIFNKQQCLEFEFADKRSKSKSLKKLFKGKVDRFHHIS